MNGTVPWPIDEAGRCAEVARVCEALSDPVRLRILRELFRGENRVMDLVQITGKRQQCISHHLTMLRLLEIVQFRRQEKSNYYRLTDRGRHAVATAATLAAA